MPKSRPVIYLAILLAALLPFLLQIAWPFLTPLILASILAIVLNPLKTRLSRRIHQLWLATLLTTLATVVLLGCVLAVAGVALTGELRSAYDALNRRSLQEGGWIVLVTHASDRVVDALANRLPLDKEAIRSEVIGRMKSTTEYLLNKAGTAVGGVTTILITVILVTVFLYFILRYGEEWVRWLSAILPFDPPVTARLFRTIQQSIVANVYGVLAVAAAQGLALSLGFWFIGLRSPALWGILGALASIVPLLGAPLVWVPVVIGLIIKGAYWKAVILGIWGALIVGSIDNVLRPLVVGARDKRHPMLIGLAMIGGTSAFGPLGILLGPLIVALAFALAEEIQELVAANRKTAQPPIDSSVSADGNMQ